MNQSISAGRVAALVGSFQRNPAYVGLADAITELVCAGRIPADVRLPSERDLTESLGVSRTTVTRAYALLRDSGYARARQGAGTFTALPGGMPRHDRALRPRADDQSALDLTCAAPSAPAGLAAAYAEAAALMPRYLGGHGYYPAGMPELQAVIAAGYAARGLPTEPDQILVVPGALAATAVVERALSRPGARVLLESPCYPNAVHTFGQRGARLIPAPLDPDGWDGEMFARIIRQTSPHLAYLVVDFHNPTGHLMTAALRQRLAAAFARAGTIALIDESHQPLALDGQSMPPPFASFAADAITVGGVSKPYWGGLRLGWLRAPRKLIEPLTEARLAMDLGAPVLEQLVASRLLAAGPVPADRLERLREQRAALSTAVAERLPDWRFRMPGGGMALWCELPAPVAMTVAREAEREGVLTLPGPVFAVQGGFERYLRLAYTRPPHELVAAVDVLAQVWRTLDPEQAAEESASRLRTIA